MATSNPDYLQPPNTVPGNLARPVGPTYQSVNENELVSGQLQGLLQSNSPYLDLARAQGTQQAASRGLLNSSMAAGSAENAAIQAALPIAQGNAQEYAQVGAANAQAANQWTGENIAARAQTQSAGIYASAQRDVAHMNMTVQEDQLAQQYKEFGVSTTDQVNEFNAAQKNAMMQFQSGQNTQVGEYESQLGWNKYSLGVQMQMHGMDQYTQMMSSMLQNPNMTADDRAAMQGNLQSIYSGYNQQIAAIPGFTPPWTADPNYWATDWTGGTTGPGGTSISGSSPSAAQGYAPPATAQAPQFP